MLTGSVARNNDTVAEYERIMAALLQAVHPAKLDVMNAQRLALAVTKFEKDAVALQATDDSKASPTVSDFLTFKSDRGTESHQSRQQGSSSWKRSQAWPQNLVTISSSTT